jgi:hypothetical protein
MTISDSYCMCGEVNSLFCHIHTEPHTRRIDILGQKDTDDEA